MIEVSIVTAEHVHAVWPHIKRYVDGIVYYTDGRYVAEDIREELEAGHKLLWIAFDDDMIYGFVVTGIIAYPRKVALFMQFIGGEEGMKWKAPMLLTLQSFARDNNCDLIEAIGRPGWAKIFGPDGLTTRSICFDLPVE